MAPKTQRPAKATAFAWLAPMQVRRTTPTMPSSLRIVPTVIADGATQMASDEALLICADQPTLRLYRWQPATVSLGYFQDFAPIAARLPTAMPIVRRITGGGAIWHEHEVTYCLVGVLGRDGFPARVRDLYPLLHGAVLNELARRGDSVELQRATTGDRRYADEPRCFASPAADDLMAAGGGKMLGSAGRARGQRVLLHGSLKLASNPWDGPTVSGCRLTWDAAAEALTAAIVSALDAAPILADMSSAELSAIQDIRAERYGDNRWVRERHGPRA